MTSKYNLKEELSNLLMTSKLNILCKNILKN